MGHSGGGDSTAERGILFATPATNQCVINLETNALERYNGGSWATLQAFTGGGAISGTTGAFSDVLSINAGAKFPATQAASSDANTLDDYEEGLWTPVIGGASGESGQSYTYQRGLYLKIGQLVWAGYEVLLSAKGTISGAVQIKGFPFAANAAMGILAPVPYWNALATAVVGISGYMQATTQVLALSKVTAAAVSADSAPMATGDIGNSTSLAGSVLYRAAA
jgi:hypothetical protein